MPFKDPVKAKEYRNKWLREKYANDPAWRALVKEQKKARVNFKYRNDPKYREHVLAAQKARNKNPEVRARKNEYARTYIKSYDVRKIALQSAKQRARRYGLPFDIKAEDIVIPEFCPILGLRLARSVGTHQDCSPSLDRVDPTLGYVRGNVTVISYRANRIKNDGTLAEHEAIVRYMREHLEDDVFSAPYA